MIDKPAYISSRFRPLYQLTILQMITATKYNGWDVMRFGITVCYIYHKNHKDTTKFEQSNAYRFVRNTYLPRGTFYDIAI